MHPVGQIRKRVVTPRRYLLTVAGVALAGIAILWAAFAYDYLAEGLDHFTAIPSSRGSTWYRDLGGLNVTEIQDQDLYFHDFGRSVENARRADVIILGSSLATFAFDQTSLEETLEKQYGLRVYNMAFVGIASGEFVKRVIKKHQLHPRLWIINADDGGGPGNFFSRSMVRSFSADVKVIPATQTNRAKAFWNVVRRNMSWRIESMEESELFQFLFPATAKPLIPMFYRNASTGEADMSAFPGYLREDNAAVKLSRSPDCHTTPEVVDIAREYMSDIGGNVVLTVVPNIHACAQQASEIARSLGLDVVLPPTTDYSSWDNGGHLDRKGAIQFTKDFVAGLVATRTFKDLGKAR